MSQVYLEYTSIVADAAEFMTEDRMIGLADIFFYMDSDQDGVVTYADLHALLDRNRGAGGEVGWVSLDDVVRSFTTQHDASSPGRNGEYIAGLTEGFVFFTDRILSDLRRELDVEPYDDGGHHTCDDMSYPAFMRLMIAQNRERHRPPDPVASTPCVRVLRCVEASSPNPSPNPLPNPSE